MADVKSFEINGTELMIKDEYARQQLNNIANQIKYISPTTFAEFVEMTSELGIFYVLSRNINITWENQTYNVIGLYDVRSHSNGYNYYGFQKMHQFVVNSTSKEITSFSSFRVYIENQIANDVELDENNLLYLVRDGAKIGNGITLPFTSGTGSDGRGITKIEKTATVGLIDTYTITYTDNTTSTFEVRNGADGEEGIGIQSVEKTSTNGLVDTYTITRTDGTIAGTFTVTNADSTGGSSEKEWKLINEITLTEKVGSITSTLNNDYKEILIIAQGKSGATSNTGMAITSYSENQTSGIYLSMSANMWQANTERTFYIYICAEKPMITLRWKRADNNNWSSVDGSYNVSSWNDDKGINKLYFSYGTFAEGNNFKIYGR